MRVKAKWLKPRRLSPKKIDETRNYILEEIKHNDLMGEKHKKECKVLNYFEHFLVLISAVSTDVSIPALASLGSLPAYIVSSVVELKFCAKTAGIYQEKAEKA